MECCCKSLCHELHEFHKINVILRIVCIFLVGVCTNEHLVVKILVGQFYIIRQSGGTNGYRRKDNS
jgi:hypothetical protein